MTQEQRNQGARDLASMLRLIIQDDGQCESGEKVPEEAGPNDDKQEEANQSEASINMEDVGEMLGKMMMEQGTTYSDICKNPKFESVLKQAIKGVTEMMSGAAKVVKDLPEEGLTVESGLAAVADVMMKNSTRSSSHDFSEYVIHYDKQMAMDIMKKMYDGLSGLKVVWLTSYFVEIGWLIEPSSLAILDTFNVKKFSKQLYSKHRSEAIPSVDRKAFSACLKNYIASYSKQGEQ